MGDFAEDWLRGQWDMAFFAQRFLGIDVHRGQNRVAEAILKRMPDGVRAAYLTICVAAGNRAGKTLILAIAYIHSCLYKAGKPVPTTEEEARKWMRRQYHVWHFAIQQEVADLVYTQLITILQGTHPAQKEGICPLAEELQGTPIADWGRKEHGEYRWVVFSGDLGGAEVHFRTTGERALGSLGRDMDLIGFDEAGIERNLPFIFGEVLNLRRLGTGGQFILVSTPSEDIGTHFADLWGEGDPENPFRDPRRLSLRMSTRDNIGYGITQDMFDALVATMPAHLISQNIDGHFIQGRAAYFNAQSVELAFEETLPEFTPPAPMGTYVQGVDPALTYDSTWSISLRVFHDPDTGEPSCVGVRAARTRGKVTTERMLEMATEAHEMYSDEAYILTAADVTGFGGKMFREAVMRDIPDLLSIELAGAAQRKRKILGDLRTMLDSGRLHMPRTGVWGQVRLQLLGYKLEDRKIEQDAVIALALAVQAARRVHSEGASSVKFEYYRFAEDKPEPPAGERPPTVTAKLSGVQ